MTSYDSPWKEILDDLGAPDEPARASAVGRVGRLAVQPPDGFCAQVVELLTSSSSDVRRTARRALANGLAKYCVAPVGAALERSPEHGEILLGAILSAASQAGPILPALLKFFGRADLHPAERAACAAILRFVDMPEAKDALGAYEAMQRAATEQRRADAMRQEEEARRKVEEAQRDPEGVVAKLPWPTTILPGDKAAKMVSKGKGKSPGIPVVLGDVVSVMWRAETGLPKATDVEATLAGMSSMDAEALMKKRILAWRRSLRGEDVPPTPSESHEVKNWPKGVKPPRRLNSCYDRDGNPLKQLCVATLPIQHSWQAPAVLGFGGFNDCPPPVEHVALLKRWHELYGVELVACGGDSLECQVRRPPKDKQSALRLAWDHCAYCSDAGEPLELAPYLLRCDFWFFWWD